MMRSPPDSVISSAAAVLGLTDGLLIRLSMIFTSITERLLPSASVKTSPGFRLRAQSVLVMA